jgi:plasmid maintenance system antidote protein VapI
MKLDVFAIKLFVAERELKLLELAKKMGCSRDGLHQILRRGSCTPKTAGRLAHALGVPVEAIVIKE